MYRPRRNSLISGRASIHWIVIISARAVQVRSPNWLWAPSARYQMNVLECVQERERVGDHSRVGILPEEAAAAAEQVVEAPR